MPKTNAGPLTPNAPALRASAVTPSNTTDLGPCRALFVGSSGDVVATLSADDNPVTFKNVPSGSILSISARIVHTTTTAADIVALY